jgi:outer membrane receptor protein involved in Fe transport
VTSITSRWKRDERIQQDGNEEIQWAFSTPTAILPYYTSQGGLGSSHPTPIEEDRTQQTSEELRLTSSGSSKFQWLVGYFYSDFVSPSFVYLNWPGAAPAFGTSNLFDSLFVTKITQNSFFGELSYQFTSKWKATVGVRRYSYDASFDVDESGVFSLTGTNAYTYFATEGRNQGLDPKYSLSYEFDRDLLLYANVAKGFRPGGGNQPIPTTGSVGAACEANLQAQSNTTSYVPPPISFGPDSVWSYEIGEKATILDSRVTVNSAAYFERWSGTQQLVPLPCGYPYTANAGDADIYGGELEIRAILMPGLLLSGNAGYTHAYFAVGSTTAGIAVGSQVTDIPDVTSSVSLSYRHPITSELTFTSNIENDYVGKRTDVTFATNQLPSYDLTNLRLGVESGKWRAVLFAKNLFNERAQLSDALQLSLNIPMYNRVAVSQPLTVGIDLSYGLNR